MAIPAASSLSPFTDPAGDSGGAPDITAVIVDNDTSGTLTFVVTTNQATLAADAELFLWLDTDANPATGDLGAEYVFALDPTGYGFASWNGSTYVDAPHPTARVAFGGGKAMFMINKSDLGGTSTLNFEVDGFQSSGDTVVAHDYAPDTGSYPYALTVAAPPPPPPTTTTPAPAPSPPPPTVSVGKVTVVASTVHAGKAFSLSAPVETDATSVKVSCTAHVGTKTVRLSARFAAGFATCIGKAPGATAGKRLAGSVTVTVTGGKDAKPFSFMIKK